MGGTGTFLLFCSSHDARVIHVSFYFSLGPSPSPVSNVQVKSYSIAEMMAKHAST